MNHAIFKHEIFYAYPTSDIAEKQQGHGYYVFANKKYSHFDRYEDALSYAQTLGTDPDRWSIDHPSNSTFLRDAEKLRVHHSRM
jgi:hypothetical protein